ncbi:MAG: methyltransferase domain-containing protein [Deltaproteobacteria bacterium]|nr:methyltransferase domain-containing protein [Deltaproteobacteria bacterium]
MDPKWYKELFENMGIEYEDYPFTKDTETEVAWMVKEYLTSPEMKILDVGCGTGRHAINLATKGYKNITGIDLSPGMIGAANKVAKEQNVQVDFRVCDARELPFQNEFDAALCLCEGAFSLLENDAENYKVLKAVHQSLKKNGIFILTTLNLFREGKFDPMTCRIETEIEITQKDGQRKTLKCSDRSYTFPELKWVLEQHGFKVISGANPFSKEPIQHGTFEFMVVSTKL